ncbi:MAG: protein kinase [Pirellulaceae bacterium]|nr:protein kinase [Pirellulaceae bacterium]
MNRRDDHVSLNIFDQIDSICREFRAELKKGKRPKLEQWFDQVPDDAQAQLFLNLLQTEIAFRNKSHETPSSDDYLRRFPQFARQVRQVFHEQSMMSVDESQASPLDDADVQTRTLVGPSAHRLGDYELLRELGRGGMGVVYGARNIKTRNQVALKTLPTGHDGQEVNAERLHRFRREFRSLSEINHPNLVGMQTLEVDGGQWFFTMDLVEGQDFLSYVRPGNQCDAERLRSGLGQLVRGLSHLHQRRIVHRDVKPSNVLVERDGTVKILDFGLVAELQQVNDMTQTRSGMFAGTPRYAAPEQMFGQRSEASDWYAVGVMLYEALTGEPPFRGNHIEVLRQKQDNDSPPLSGRADLPADLADLADRMLRRDPSQRPTMAVIAERLGLNFETRGTAGSTDSAGEEGFLESMASEQILIGRDDQLAQLDQSKDELLRTRQPQVVMIRGLSGEGKSALAEKFLHPLRMGTEMLVLSGRCYDRESVPFKAVDCLIDSLVSFLRGRKTEQLAVLLPDDIAMLAHIFPMLRRVPLIADRCGTGQPTVDSKQIRYRAFAALRDLLVNISKSLPVVLFVDDLQWGDADSAEAMAGLLQPPEAPAVMLLGSFRRDEADESPFLKAWYKSQVDKPNPISQRIVEVHPLTPDQCLTLVAMRVGIAPGTIKEQASELFTDTQGNPYFLEQLIEGYDAATCSFRAVPLNEIIATKLKRLPPNASQLLDVIAVAGKAVTLSEASQVAGHDRPAFETITHMRSERLVRLVGSGDQQLVDTYHDKIRETTLGRMDAAARQTLHLEFAESIQSSQAIDQAAVEAFLSQSFAKPVAPPFSTARIYDLAYHFHLAEDPRATSYQLLAGELAFQSYASDEAIQFLLRTNTVLQDNVPKDRRARLWHRLAVSSSRILDFDRAVAQFEAGIEYTESGLERAFFYAGIASVHQTRATYDLATEFHDRALSALGRKRPKGLIAYLTGAINFGKLFFFPEGWLRGKPGESNEELRLEQAIYIDLVQLLFDRIIPLIEYPAALMRLATLSHRCDDAGLACGVAMTSAHLGISGLPKMGRQLARRAMARIGDRTDPETEGIYRYCTASALSYSGDFSVAHEEFAKSIPLLTRAGSHFHCAPALHMWRHLFEAVGTASAEVSAARKLIELTSNSGDLRSLCWGQYDLAGGLARHGQIGDAVIAIEQAQKSWQSVRLNMTTPIFFAQRSFVFLQASKYELARSSSDFSWRIAIRHFRLMDVALRSLAWHLECVAGPHWATAPHDLDRGLIRKRCRWARILAIFHVKIRPHLLRARGRALVALGKKHNGIRSIEKAVRVARDLGMKYDLAKALLDLAAIKESGRDQNRREAVALLKEMESVIPRAEAWLLGDQYDEAVVAPEFDLAAWEQKHGPITPTPSGLVSDEIS